MRQSLEAWCPNGTFKKVASATPVEVDPVEQRWKKKPNTLHVSLDSENAFSGSAGLDTYASEGVCIPAGGSGLVSTGISIEMPAGVYARIAPLAVKNRIAVGGGVIDPDYDGEVKVILFNHGDEDFIVRPGDRIEQIVLERVMLINESIVPRKLRRKTDRGSAGFGSTGVAAAAPTIGSDGLQKEWDKLTSQGRWDLSTVQEWHDVAARARKEGEKIHVGRIFSTSASRRIMSFLKTIQIVSIKGEASLRDVLSVMRSGIGPCSPKTPPAPPLWRRERWVMLTGYFPEIFWK